MKKSKLIKKPYDTGEDDFEFDSDHGKNRVYPITLGLILLFSGVMRFRGLDTESFWLDELTTLHAISQGTWKATMEGWLSMVGMGTWLMYFWKIIQQA